MIRAMAPALTLILCVSGICRAENAVRPAPPDATAQPAPALPAMVAPWSQNEDYARYDTARDAIRRRAEWKAEQRRLRMAGLSWMGYSPLRPPVSPVPMMGSYSGFSGTALRYSLPGLPQPGIPWVIMGQAETTANR